MRSEVEAWSPFSSPLTILNTASACLHCPKHLLCFGGHALGTQDDLRVCPRCWCVYFETSGETFLCGRLRWGQYARPRPSAMTAEGFIRNAIFVNNWGDLPKAHTSACARKYEEMVHRSYQTQLEGKTRVEPTGIFWNVEHPLNFCILKSGTPLDHPRALVDQPQLFDPDWCKNGVLHGLESKNNFTLKNLPHRISSVKELQGLSPSGGSLEEKQQAFVVLQMSTEDCISLITTKRVTCEAECCSVTVY